MSADTTLSNYLNRTTRTIWGGGPRLHYDEARALNGSIKPGHCLQVVTDSAEKKVKPQAVPGAKHPFIIAVEDNLQGYTIDDAYASGDPVRYVQCVPGDTVKGRLPAGALAVTFGDLLTFTGDGTLSKLYATGVLQYSQVAASAAVSDTVTETAFNQSYSIPANSVKAGDVFKIRTQGIATATNSTDTLNIKLKIGSTIIAATGALDVANNDSFIIDATIVFRTIGASGTLVGTGIMTIGTGGTVTVKHFLLASTAVDTTAAMALTVTATWSVANAGNSARMDVLTVEKSSGGSTNGPLGGGVNEPVAVANQVVDNSAAIVEAFCDVLVI